MTFDIDKQFEFYLEKVKLRLDKDSAQYVEQRRTFYAACGQMLVWMEEQSDSLSDDELLSELENIKFRVLDFFNRQI